MEAIQSILLKFLRILLIAFLLGGLVLSLFQEKLIFYPEILSQDFKFTYRLPFVEEFVEVEKGVQINTLHFKADSAKGVVLYFHGNAGSLASWGGVSETFVPKGYDLFINDYRGYGKSGGKISSEQSLYADSEILYQKIVEQYGEERVIVMGRSIGTAIAARLASLNSPKMLILETPYYNLTDLLKLYYPFVPASLLKYKFSNNEYLPKVKVPVHLIHGTQDEVIPYNSSLRLQEENPKAQLYTVEGGNHNDLSNFEKFHTVLSEILR